MPFVLPTGALLILVVVLLFVAAAATWLLTPSLGTVDPNGLED